MPVSPEAEAALLITGAGGFTVRLKLAVPDPEALVAVKVTVLVPAAVGVPEIAPEVVLIDSPDGRPVAE